jgi:hypothetical protein
VGVGREREIIRVPNNDDSLVPTRRQIPQLTAEMPYSVLCATAFFLLFWTSRRLSLSSMFYLLFLIGLVDPSTMVLPSYHLLCAQSSRSNIIEVTSPRPSLVALPPFANIPPPITLSSRTKNTYFPQRPHPILPAHHPRPVSLFSMPPRSPT